MMRTSAARGLISCLTLMLCLVAIRAARAATDPLAAIRQRGTLVVGVKTDYPPFGQLNASGQIVGFEPDLAADLARRMGVKLKLVGVTSANRLQKLQDGTVDVVIATLGDTEQRRQIADLIEPNYYASGMDLMLPPNSHVKSWTDLRGQSVCATRGVYANRLMAQRYLLEPRVFNTNRDALLALKDGRCVGWMQDDTLIVGVMTSGDWAGYTMPLPAVMQLPWSIAITSAYRGSTLERFVSDTVADWHRSGFLIKTERAHHIPPSDFLRRTNILWNRLDKNGGYVCHRDAKGGWPNACRNRALITSTDASGIQHIGLLINERLGLNFTYLYDSYDRPLFFTALLRSLLLIVGCVIGGFVVGVAGALAMARRVPIIGGLVRGVLTFSRMTPPLLQIYVIFFGLGGFMGAHWGVTPNAIMVVVLCLSLYSGAANAFSLVDAAEVLFARVPDFTLSLATMPRALSLARGPVIGSLVNAVKATGMASAIAVPEIISASTSIMAERGNIGVMMNTLMIVYFVMVLGILRLLTSLERRLPAV
jgi:polar amino acid transport system substrate-binding protein